MNNKNLSRSPCLASKKVASARNGKLRKEEVERKLWARHPCRHLRRMSTVENCGQAIGPWKTAFWCSHPWPKSAKVCDLRELLKNLRSEELRVFVLFLVVLVMLSYFQAPMGSNQRLHQRSFHSGWPRSVLFVKGRSEKGKQCPEEWWTSTQGEDHWITILAKFQFTSAAW